MEAEGGDPGSHTVPAAGGPGRWSYSQRRPSPRRSTGYTETPWCSARGTSRFWKEGRGLGGAEPAGVSSRTLSPHPCPPGPRGSGGPLPPGPGPHAASPEHEAPLDVCLHLLGHVLHVGLRVWGMRGLSRHLSRSRRLPALHPAAAPRCVGRSPDSPRSQATRGPRAGLSWWQEGRRPRQPRCDTGWGRGLGGHTLGPHRQGPPGPQGSSACTPGRLPGVPRREGQGARLTFRSWMLKGSSKT